MPLWHLSSEPEVVIGAADGTEDDVFTLISAAFTSPDGRLVIANKDHPPEIRIYAPDGTLLQRIGRAGEGPGEFKGVTWVQQKGRDTLVAYDLWLSRLTQLTMDGAVLSTATVQVGAASPGVWALLGLAPDGTAVARPNMSAVSGSGPSRSKTSLQRVDVATGELSPIAVVDDLEFVPTSRNVRGTIRPVFGLTAPVVIADGRVFVGAGDRFRVDEYSVRGDTIGSFAMDYERRDVDAADLEAHKERVLAGSRAEDVVHTERYFRDAPAGEQFPALEATGMEAGKSILLDSEQRLWVQEYLMPRADSAHWIIFSAEREPIARLLVDRALRLTQVDGGRVVAVHTDDVGVQTVRVYELIII